MPVEFRDYDVVEEIGEGGMGVVYRGRHKLRGVEVAIKLIHGHLAGKKEARDRFLEEARILDSLDHPNILKLVDYFEDAGRLAIVTSFLRGKPLDKILKEQEFIPYEQGLRWLVEILCGVAYAHGRNIIHRDLKTSNIFVTDEGEVKILDFGLGKDLCGDAQMTATGQVLGTPAYLPPETYRIENKVAIRDVGPRGDIFALGVIAYRMFSGRLPFDMGEGMSSSDAFALLAVRYNSHAPITSLGNLDKSLPQPLVDIVMRCLVQEPEHRPESVDDLLHDIEQTVPGGDTVIRECLHGPKTEDRRASLSSGHASAASKTAKISFNPGSAKTADSHFNKTETGRKEEYLPPAGPRQKRKVLILVTIFLFIGAAGISGLLIFKHRTGTTVAIASPSSEPSNSPSLLDVPINPRSDESNYEENAAEKSPSDSVEENAPKPASDPKQEMEQREKLKRKSKQESRAEPKQKPAPKPKLKSRPEPEPVPQPAPEPVPQPAPEPVPQPTPEPTPLPTVPSSPAVLPAKVYADMSQLKAARKRGEISRAEYAAYQTNIREKRAAEYNRLKADYRSGKITKTEYNREIARVRQKYEFSGNVASSNVSPASPVQAAPPGSVQQASPAASTVQATQPVTQTSFSTMAELKAAYRRGQITRSEYAGHQAEIRRKRAAEYAQLKNDYQQGKTTKNEYKRKVNLVRQKYEGN